MMMINRQEHPCLKRDSNPRSQRPSDLGLHLRPRGHKTRSSALDLLHGNRKTGAVRLRGAFCNFSLRTIHKYSLLFLFFSPTTYQGGAWGSGSIAPTHSRPRHWMGVSGQRHSRYPYLHLSIQITDFSANS
jgi:hypothetical protein